jgi:hypothetical protein
VSRRIDYTGQRFGKLVALEFRPLNGRSAWICQCDCGAESRVDTQNLRRGVTKSCGCMMNAPRGRKPKPPRQRPVDITGQRFSRLTAIVPMRSAESGRFSWLCRCECGTYLVVITSNLRRGNTTSCGCYRSKNAVIMSEKRYAGVCRNCERPYAGTAKAKFCSPECTTAFHLNRLWPKTLHICAQCATEFRGRKERVYCSDRCKRTAANRRNHATRLPVEIAIIKREIDNDK